MTPKNKNRSRSRKSVRNIGAGGSAHPPVPETEHHGSRERMTEVVRVPCEPSLRDLVRRVAGHRGTAEYFRASVLARLRSEGTPWDPATG